ncbi:MAG: T9SS type A sorting domain-containing protein [Reichenbachiella sp.]|uniref:T9SS type A sorting domain-containing protein n=1 Tax=Reichenbachiella sp. TaxID=2184521 RepID=UPI0029660AFF|nr:T9SS type A sorting domain-containing protein [Reichenbachiella sp.]MDW3210168.1 T9SS type A sorting domain-containing protein [Reichenbachiella sp.]
MKGTLVLTLLSIGYHAACISCDKDNAPPGQFINTSTCEYELAPIGTYSPGGNITAAINCPAGKYQDQEGQTSCLLCAAGKYQDQEGQFFCNSCDPGTYQDQEGQSFCLSCSAGKYQDQEGKTSCISCAAGKYQDQEGQISCVLCEAGKYQDEEGQTSCKGCTEGTTTIGEGSASCDDSCVDDANKTSPGICGCGVPDTDSDQDGTADCVDDCVDDPNKAAPGVCGCGVADTDSDGDGTLDCETVLGSSVEKVININPNPTNGIVNIDLGTASEVSIKVFTILGKLVHANEHMNTSFYQFELKGEPGVYLIELTMKGKVSEFKMIKR